MARQAQRSSKRNDEAGYTLFEILMVMAIIALIATFAIPNVVEARKNGNEGVAATSLRHLVSAQAMFRERDKDGDEQLDYAASLAELAAADVLDDSLTGGEKSGYSFELLGVTEFTWSAVANPLDPGRTGDRYFFVDHSGVVRYSSTGQATAADPPYGG